MLTLEFFGQIFSADGTRPDPQRVVDLQNVATPTTVQEVRSLLGMANYSSQYIPNFATITAPLRLLTKNDTPFVWTTVHKNAFDNLKAALTSAPCMAYFDIHKETFVVVDANPVGVSYPLTKIAKCREFQSHCLRQSCLIARRNMLLPNRTRSPRYRLGCRTFPHVPFWTSFYVSNRPQTP